MGLAGDPKLSWDSFCRAQGPKNEQIETEKWKHKRFLKALKFVWNRTENRQIHLISASTMLFTL